MKRLCFVLLLACSVSMLAGEELNINNQIPKAKTNLMIQNGLKFLGTPYVAHTLEVNSPDEKLVVNLKEVDCTTFVEYVLAKSLCNKQNDSIQFLKNLKRIRYRNGILDGYTSRLHYSTEWASNGVRNGYLTDIAGRYSKDTISVHLNFMSTHPQAYKQLASSPDNVKVIAGYEKRLSGQIIHYIPKAKLPKEGFRWIHSGDIIMLVTSIKGLDNSHLGIAIYQHGELHLLHASSANGKVIIQPEPLCQQLQNNSKCLGIRVLRMKK